MAEAAEDLAPTHIIDNPYPADVDIQIRSDAGMLWVNVNGVCRLRTRVNKLHIVDGRLRTGTPEE